MNVGRVSSGIRRNAVIAALALGIASATLAGAAAPAPVEGPPAEWWSSVQESIAASVYEVTLSHCRKCLTEVRSELVE